MNLTNKIKLLQELKEQVEVVIAINASNIEHSKARGDLGISYDQEVLRLIDKFNEFGIFVGSVVITQYAGQPAADAFRNQLEKTELILIFIIQSKGYPTDMDHIISQKVWEKRLHQNQSQLDCRNRSWTWFWKIGNLYVQYVPRPNQWHQVWLC